MLIQVDIKDLKHIADSLLIWQHFLELFQLRNFVLRIGSCTDDAYLSFIRFTNFFQCCSFDLRRACRGIYLGNLRCYSLYYQSLLYVKTITYFFLLLLYIKDTCFDTWTSFIVYWKWIGSCFTNFQSVSFSNIICNLPHFQLPHFTRVCK